MKNFLILVLCVLSLSLVARSSGQTGVSPSYRNYATRSSPILDTPFPTSSHLEIGHTMAAETTAPAWDDVSVTELNGWTRFLYWENDIGGDIEMQAALGMFVLRGFDGGSSAYPLTSLTVPTRWSQRYEQNFGLQVEAAPGLYTALDGFSGNAIGLPLGARFIKDISNELSVFAGARLYPGFDQTFDPWLGVYWSVKDEFTAEIAYPETRLVFGPLDGWRFIAGYRMLRWPEYSMGDDDREKIRYNESRLTAGIEWPVSEWLDLTIQGGYVFNRKLAFKSESDDVEMDDSIFVAFGFSIRE